MSVSTVELQPEEQVLAVVRRSVCRELPRFFFAAIFILIPFFFFFPLMRLGGFGFVLFIVILGLALLYSSRLWVMWFYSVLIITDERIIDSEQQGLFKREISELDIQDIDEVECDKKGAMQKMCRLSTVYIRTKKDRTFDIKVSDLKHSERFESLLEAVQDIHAEASLGSRRKVVLKKKHGTKKVNKK